MPKQIIDYSKSVIYRIVCNDIYVTECYVGSTTNLIKRRAQHKTRCHNLNDHKSNNKVYEYIRDNEGYANFTVVLIESYPCLNKEELLKRERHWIEHYKATLNCKIPTRTNKEYYTDNKEQITIKNKMYVAKNRIKTASYQKQYAKDNAESLHKYITQYSQDNKAKISTYKKEKHLCNCGMYFTIGHRNRHMKSQYHINNSK